MSVDVDTTDNGPNAVGTIEECREISVGETIEIDVVVKSAPTFRAFEAYVLFDEAVLSATEHNDNFMLQGFSASDPGPFPDTDGNHLLSVFSTQQTGLPSGDGVLGRLKLQATGVGISQLTPGYPTMNDEDGQGVNIDGFGARIAVGVSCDATITPSPTPSPTPDPTNSPTPTNTQYIPPTAYSPSVTPVPTATPVPTITPIGTPIVTSRVTITPYWTIEATPDTGPTIRPPTAVEDADCDGELTVMDAIRVLFTYLGQPQLVIGCPDVGATVQGGSLGDTDCEEGIALGDILALLFRSAGLNYGC